MGEVECQRKRVSERLRKAHHVWLRTNVQVSSFCLRVNTLCRCEHEEPSLLHFVSAAVLVCLNENLHTPDGMFPIYCMLDIQTNVDGNFCNFCPSHSKRSRQISLLQVERAGSCMSLAIAVKCSLWACHVPVWTIMCCSIYWNSCQIQWEEKKSL